MSSSDPASIPPPIDYSPFLVQSSQNMLTGMQMQIGANMIAERGQTMTQQLGMMTNMVTSLEGLDTKMQIAKLNFLEQMDKHQVDYEGKLLKHEEVIHGQDLQHQMDQADQQQQVASSSTIGNGWTANYNDFASNHGGYDAQQGAHDVADQWRRTQQGGNGGPGTA